MPSLVRTRATNALSGCVFRESVLNRNIPLYVFAKEREFRMKLAMKCTGRTNPAEKSEISTMKKNHYYHASTDLQGV